MFIGKYYHTLETKGRLSLPKAFRSAAENFVITRGLDGGLFLFTATAFQEQIQQFSQRPFTKKRTRDFVRLMTNEARVVTPDANGRIQLPEYLIELAKLQKSVVVVGSLNRIELWDQDEYHAYIDTLETQAEELAESLETSNAD